MVLFGALCDVKVGDAVSFRAISQGGNIVITELSAARCQVLAADNGHLGLNFAT